ncbi:MAG: RCC1 domain-containing protein [Gemmatimonadales bacterium]
MLTACLLHRFRGSGSALAVMLIGGLGLSACGDAVRPTAPSTPGPEPRVLSFVSVTAGYDHSCGLTATGVAYCWGGNEEGQLGDGTPAVPGAWSTVPKPVIGGLTFASVTAGAFHTCGVATSGTAYCWGFNVAGQVGDGTKNKRNEPVPVTGGFSFTSVSAGGGHTCGVTTSAAAYCWGDLGEGRATNDRTTGSTVPMAVAGGLTFESIDVGGDHRCGTTDSGAAYCWGAGHDGRLGDGSTVDRNSSPAAVAGGLAFAQVGAGATHTCGLSTSGTTYCWGFNGSGQLGIGSNGASYVPAEVVGGLSFVSLSTGDNHTCGVTTGGDAYCWGLNSYGQLGDGSRTNHHVPVPVASGLTFESVSAGRSHACGVTTTGETYCWGRNDVGTLGDGTTIDRNVPVLVGGQTISAGTG